MVLKRTAGILKGTTVVEVIPNVYQLVDRLVNITLIVEEKITLIDTGLPGTTSKIIDFVRKLRRSPREIKLIIITHNHLDHIGGLIELKKLTRAKIAIHKADMATTNSQIPYPWVIREPLRFPPFSILRHLFQAEPRAVDILLEGGEILPPLGGLEVIHTPGHTPGSISLFSPQKKLLFIGDLLNNRFDPPRPPSKLFSTDLAQAIESLKKLAQLDFEILCFGHGSPLTTNASATVQELINKFQSPLFDEKKR